MLRDLDGDNVAIVDTRGAVGPQQAHLLTLAAEWRYDAYETVNWSRIHGPHPVLACGHRGVFFDRLDEPVIRFAAEAASGDSTLTEPSLGETWDTRVLVEPQVAGTGFDLPTGKPKIIGHMRNREYLPHLMRFAQRDPNATGQLVTAALAHSGRALANSASAMNLAGLYGDGPSLYAYLGSSPRGRADATGLSWDPFDAVDEIVAEHAASQAAFLEGVISGFDGAFQVASQLAQLHPGVAMAMSVYRLAAGEADLYDLASVVRLLPGAAKFASILDRAVTILDVMEEASEIADLIYDGAPYEDVGWEMAGFGGSGGGGSHFTGANIQGGSAYQSATQNNPVIVPSNNPPYALPGAHGKPGQKPDPYNHRNKEKTDVPPDEAARYKLAVGTRADGRRFAPSAEKNQVYIYNPGDLNARNSPPDSNHRRGQRRQFAGF